MRRDFTLAVGVVTLLLLSQTKASPLLLFANRRDIRIVDAGRPNHNSTVVIGGFEDAAAVDFLFDDELVFWTDVSLEVIQSASLNNTQLKRDLVTTSLVSPDGLAVDWICRKLYWTDSDTNRIEVSELDGAHRKVLYWEGLDQPRDIVLDPLQGYMYWSDWGEEPKIERAGMDGDPATRSTIVSENIQWPNGLAIDYDTEKLYWADAKLLSISMSNLDGSERREVISGSLKHPFSLTLYEDQIYWTDWTDRAIFSCNKLTGLPKRKIHSHIYSPMYIHALSAKRQPKGRNPCEASPCSHLCLMSPVKPFYSCACPTGILLLEDKHTCADGFRDILLLARRTDLRRISLDTPDYTDVVIQVEGVLHAVAIDYDHVDDYVYWTDDETKAISRAHLDGTGQEMVISSEVDSPDGVAVDWVARNLYWTDTGTNRIEVSRLNGTSRKVLISEGHDEPRAIALDPYGGFMFWTDWGKEPKIERAYLDGSERKVLINTSIGWPNGLAIDFSQRKIYWGDAQTDRIEFADMDGRNRQSLLSGQDVLPHIFGFTLLGDYIYWTDWQRRTIDRTNKYDGKSQRPIMDLLPDLMGLKAINMSLKQGTNVCGVNNGGCSHLCFLRPWPLGPVCACPMGLELMKDGKTCIVPEAFLLFAHRTDIRRISLEFHHNNMIIPLQGVREATALDFDINDSRIYWTDTNLKSISRAFMNGSALEHIVEFGLDFPEGMAVDWVAHNLYWADTGTSRIEMARMDGSSRRVLVWSEVEPRALVINPPDGHIFFSNWYKSPLIERADLDGSNRIPLIPHTGRVNGLTVDFQDQRLYWASVDSRVIESASLLGEDRREVVQGLMHPFSLTQYQDYIYWADWNSKSIERANKSNGTNRTQIQGKMEYIMDILIFHNSRQSGWNACGINNGGCSHLCVASTVNNTLTHRCACPTHYTLAADNMTCTPPASFLLCGQKNTISRMMPEPSGSPYMSLPIRQIRNIRAIDYDPITNNIYWVDRRSKAIKFANINGSKVETAISDFEPYDLAIDVYTRHIYWTDAQDNVIRLSRLDGTDVGVIFNQPNQKPRSIAIASSHGYMFWINLVDPPKIERAALDGTSLQTQFSTELGLPSDIAADEDSQKIFWTDSKFQIVESANFDGSHRQTLVREEVVHPIGLTVLGEHLYWVDRETEVMQRMNKVSPGEGRAVMHSRLVALRAVHAVTMVTLGDVQRHPCGVANGGCSHICVAGGASRRCSCPMELVLDADHVHCGSPPTCEASQFTCHAGATGCIPLGWRCDGVAECDDGSDEADCGGGGPGGPCVAGHVHICGGHGGPQCVALARRCDGRVDCDDGSDEARCPPCDAADASFQCVHGRQCLPAARRCDGHQDCPVTGEDEIGCRDSASPPAPNLQHKSNMIQYLIAIMIVLLVLIGILLLIVFMCRKKTRHVLLDESHEALTAAAQVHNKNQLDVDLHGGGLLGAGGATALVHCNLITLSSTTNNSKLTFNTAPSSSGPPYERNHITGASASSSSASSSAAAASSLAHYFQETLNPPPSPITSRGDEDDDRSGLYDDCSESSASLATAPYRHIPPLPTPVSTDACEDSEPAYRTTRRKTRRGPRAPAQSQPSAFLFSHGDPLCPPPPTPRSDGSCPPSPSTVRSYYNPYPPPPSPVGSSEC